MYFKDKGDYKPGDKLEPGSNGYNLAKSYLSDKALWRRAKVLPESEIVNYSIENIFDSKENFNGKYPYGEWIIQLDYSDKSNRLLYPQANAALPDISWLKDLIMVVEYRADIHYNR